MASLAVQQQFAEFIFRMRRFLLQRRLNEMTAKVLEGIDHGAFIERFRPFWDPFPTIASSKFLNLEAYIREAVFRIHWCGVPQLPAGSRVLDLGCGTGYFLYGCRQLGHDVLGLDLDEDPLYREMFAFFGLPRAIHTIRPGVPLPDLGAPFDLVTAFMTCFDRHDDLSPWTGAEWSGFLSDLHTHIKPGGQCVILFNRNPRNGAFYTSEVKRAIQTHPGFNAGFLHCYARLHVI